MTGTNHEERSDWAELCESFHDYRYAAAIGFQEEWAACVEETHAGRGSLARWHELVADITKAHGLDRDFSGRNGDQAGSLTGDVAATLRMIEPAFTCPMDICDRREQARTVGSPMCDLFGKGMNDPSAGGR